jgi:hypothetical protein
MSIALKAIAVVLFALVAIFGITFAVGLPLNFIM